MEKTFVLTNFVVQIMAFSVLWYTVLYAINQIWEATYGPFQDDGDIKGEFYKLLLLIPTFILMCVLPLLEKILEFFLMIFYGGFGVFSEKYNKAIKNGEIPDNLRVCLTESPRI